MNPYDQDSNDERVVAIIRRARQLVERGWCQCSFARVIAPSVDYQADCRDPYVTHLCLEGALDRAAFEITTDICLRGWLFDVACSQVRAVLGIVSLTCYNDRLGRLQTEILELLDRAAGEK